MRKTCLWEAAGLGLIAMMIINCAMAQDISPQRKAGWWEMDSQIGRQSFRRNLCLDATSDSRNNIFKQPGCTMTAQRIPGGYSYRKVCGIETTTGTAIGNFSSSYTIIERRGTMEVITKAQWMGNCPAGHKADEMWISG
jgi:hypothetical protein